MPTNPEEMRSAFQAALEGAVKKDRQGFHLDLNINLALLVTLLGIWGYSAWYLSKQEARTTALETAGLQVIGRVDKLTDTLNEVKEKLTHVDDRTESILAIQRRALPSPAHPP